MLKRKSILIVNEKHHLRVVLSKILRRGGFAVYSSANGSETLSFLRSQPVDLILIETTQPSTEALHLIAGLSKAGYAIPILILLSDHSENLVGDKLYASAIQYLLKPVDSCQVLAAVNMLLHEDVYNRALAPIPKKSLAITRRV